MLACYFARVALPLVALAILASEAKTNLINIAKAAPLMNRLAGPALIRVGIYPGYYCLAFR